MSGLTPEGLVVPTTEEILSQIEADQLRDIDAALNLSPTQPLGQLNAIFASALADAWGALAAIYSALDPDAAEGVLLDNVSAISGTTRKPATSTVVSCTVTLAAGTYPAGALVANIAGQPEYTFSNRDTISASGGSLTAVFVAARTGPIPCNGGTLSVITTPVTGWTSISNPAAGVPGSNIEVDTALRIRRAAELVPEGGGTLDAIRLAVLKVQNVISVTVLENAGDDWIADAPDQSTITMAPHSIAVIVWDGRSSTYATPLADPQAIAQAIWSAKPAGVATVGYSTGVATDSTGTERVIRYSRVYAIPLYFGLTVKVDPRRFDATNGPVAIQQAIVALQSVPDDSGYVLGPGVPAIVDRFRAAALSVPGVLSVTSLAMGSSPSPSGASDLSVSPWVIWTLSMANIAVTVAP